MDEANWKSRDGYLSNIVDLFVKTAIPLAMAYFAWVQNNGFQANQKSQQETAFDIALTGMAWPTLIGSDGEKKGMAFSWKRVRSTALWPRS